MPSNLFILDTYKTCWQLKELLSLFKWQRCHLSSPQTHPHIHKTREYTQNNNNKTTPTTIFCSDVISATVAFSKNCFHFLSFIWLHIATVQPFYVLAYIHKLNKTWIIYQYLIKLNICHFVDPALYIGKTRI